ncbi:hypothetical protein AB0M10_15300 [Streptomyces sp. NPDC051840]|uniref:hypothetical protein n=1 Tax=Streptomyces sp. NPDC051840 TaxID=3154752 RepID=UPI00341FACF0
MSVHHLDAVSVGPSGIPCSYDLAGRPASLRDAAWLMESLERRTLYATDLRLATGEWVTMRTVGLVFDPDAATGMIVSENYRPPVWGVALYTPAPENALLEVLCTYDDPERAVADHAQSMTMICVGTEETADEPVWACRLSWAGPGR